MAMVISRVQGKECRKCFWLITIRAEVATLRAPQIEIRQNLPHAHFAIPNRKYVVVVANCEIRVLPVGTRGKFAIFWVCEFWGQNEGQERLIIIKPTPISLIIAMRGPNFYWESAKNSNSSFVRFYFADKKSVRQRISWCCYESLILNNNVASIRERLKKAH